MVQSVWSTMDAGGFSLAMRRKLKHFNGKLFKECQALPVNPAQLELLIEAGESDWSDVEPAIFGTLLERALDDRERHKLGAHYTPRAYVERLVLPTVIEPLREQWKAARAAAFTLTMQGKNEEARKAVNGFLVELCNTTVLAPFAGRAAYAASLQSRGQPTTAAELAKSFTGNQSTKVGELLQTLAALGQAREVGEGKYVA
jgi:hypothetical protein